MRTEFESFFNSPGMMNPHGTNDILYSAEFNLLGGELTIEQADLGINKYYCRDIDSFKDNDGLSISHDNYDGCMSLSKQFDLPYHKKFRAGHQNLMPWDLIFYMFISEGIFHYISLPLLFIPSFNLIRSVYVKSYKTIGGKQILSTDGKLLAFLRINTFNLSITRYICNKIVKQRWGSWSFFFETYFGPNHPNTTLAKEKNI